MNHVLERIDKAMEYKNDGKPYSASEEIKKRVLRGLKVIIKGFRKIVERGAHLFFKYAREGGLKFD